MGTAEIEILPAAALHLIFLGNLNSRRLSADHGAGRDHEADKGAYIEQAVRRVSAPEKEKLGQAFLGKRLLLCHGRIGDRRND